MGMSELFNFGKDIEPVATRDWAVGGFSETDAADALTRMGWKLAHTSKGLLVAKRGSRLQLRLLGAGFKRVRENMPVLLIVSFDSARIHAEVTPDPGWYLFGFKMSDLYKRSGESGFEALDRLVPNE
ncbi:hypothetical protein RVF87_06440 [Gordonia hydrophobica]|uniref:Uncharacterized protein n=1 Tax=Gordonia hydrophobica TaxID=40516 RepID=A0ABZ2U5H8_9ACTN|nr:hypothetical protein [Gordonia hydrophobica]MBM7368212.1 hypothetical protein [Gordonia hydrophobica]